MPLTADMNKTQYESIFIHPPAFAAELSLIVVVWNWVPPGPVELIVRPPPAKVVAEFPVIREF